MIDFLTLLLWVATGFAWGYLAGRTKGYRLGHAHGVRRRRLIESQVSQ